MTSSSEAGGWEEELQQEVALLQSKRVGEQQRILGGRKLAENGVIYSLNCFSDNVRKESDSHKKNLRELKKEYQQIEKKFKSKIIDDLAGFYFTNPEPSPSPAGKTKIIKSRSVNIEIQSDGSVKTSRLPQTGRVDSRQGEDENSVARSVTISIGKHLSESVL